MKKPALILIPLIALTLCSPFSNKDDLAGVQQISFIHQNRLRSFLLYKPQQKTSSPLPLMIVLHGAGGTAEGMIKITRQRFNRLADEKGFIVAYPKGIRNTWNDGRDDDANYVFREGIDDVGFISAVINYLSANSTADAGRVFVTGLSNGGFMCFRLACELSDKICGIAAVTASLPVEMKNRCLPGKSVNIMIINGTKDHIVPYNGGDLIFLGINRGKIMSSEETFRYWARKNGCTGKTRTEELPDTDHKDQTTVTSLSFSSCKSNTQVKLYTVINGGHTWPGGSQYLNSRFIGHTSHDISACDIIWNFFSTIK